jgi:hypothetical protein
MFATMFISGMDCHSSNQTNGFLIPNARNTTEIQTLYSHSISAVEERMKNIYKCNTVNTEFKINGAYIHVPAIMIN